MLAKLTPELGDKLVGYTCFAAFLFLIAFGYFG